MTQYPGVHAVVSGTEDGGCRAIVVGCTTETGPPEQLARCRTETIAGKYFSSVCKTVLLQNYAAGSYTLFDAHLMSFLCRRSEEKLLL